MALAWGRESLPRALSRPALPRKLTNQLLHPLRPAVIGKCWPDRLWQLQAHGGGCLSSARRCRARGPPPPTRPRPAGPTHQEAFKILRFRDVDPAVLHDLDVLHLVIEPGWTAQPRSSPHARAAPGPAPGPTPLPRLPPGPSLAAHLSHEHLARPQPSCTHVALPPLPSHCAPPLPCPPSSSPSCSTSALRRTGLLLLTSLHREPLAPVRFSSHRAHPACPTSPPCFPQGLSESRARPLPSKICPLLANQHQSRQTPQENRRPASLEEQAQVP